jgi:hypothetical protein
MTGKGGAEEEVFRQEEGREDVLLLVLLLVLLVVVAGHLAIEIEGIIGIEGIEGIEESTVVVADQCRRREDETNGTMAITPTIGMAVNVTGTLVQKRTFNGTTTTTELLR